jgi:hypothetical protein
MSNVSLSAAPTNGSAMTLNVTISNPTTSSFTGTMYANIWDKAKGIALPTQSISITGGSTTTLTGRTCVPDGCIQTISITGGSTTTLTFRDTPVNSGLHSYDFFMVSDISGQNTKAPWGFSCLDYLAGVGFTVG